MSNPGLILGEARRRSNLAKSKRTRLEIDPDREGDRLNDRLRRESSESSKRNRQDEETLSQAMESYSYLFPDLEAMVAPSVQEVGGFNVTKFGQNGAPPARPSDPVHPQKSFVSAGHEGATSYDWQTYQGPQGSAPSAQADFSDFGLSIPRSSHPSSSFSDAEPLQRVGDSYPPRQSTAPPASSSQHNPPAEGDDVNDERQRQLREAVAHMTRNSEATSDGPVMPSGELEHRSKLHSEVRQSMEETDGLDTRTDAFQVSHETT